MFWSFEGVWRGAEPVSGREGIRIDAEPFAAATRAVN